MRKSLHPLLVASAAFIAPQMASAALVVGYHNFADDDAVAPGLQDNTPDVLAGGFTSSLVIHSTPPTDDGGTNPTWGDSGIPTGAIDNVVIWLNPTFGSPPGTVTAGFFELTLTSNGGSASLSTLLFDYGATSDASFTIEIFTNGGALPIDTVTRNVTSTSDASNAGYGADSSLSLSAYALSLSNVGDSVTFRFTNTTTGGNGQLAFDNIAIVPEPGSLLALGALMGGGVFFRSRRRRA